MYLIKAFASSPFFVDNTVGEVAVIGELSKDSLTYSIETGIYNDSAISDVTIFTFKSELNSDPVPVPEPHLNLMLNLSDFIYKRSINQEILSAEDEVLSLIVEYLGVTVTNVAIGNVITDGSFWIPEWVSFKSNYGDSEIKIWFSDNSFSNQYEEGLIKVLMPIDNIDLFFTNREVVADQIASNGIAALMPRIELIKEDSPYTAIRVSSYNWINPFNPEDKILVAWTVLVYGISLDNPDSIRNALVDWVLENSTHTLEEWIGIMPDLFSVNEFILTPLWHKFAIPNQTIISGFNSPIVEVMEIDPILRMTCKGVGFGNATLSKNSISTVTPIRNLSLLATGNDFNNTTITLLNEIIPDYINVSMSSTDFSRMSQSTQLWVNMLISLMIEADKLTPDTAVSVGFSRIVRDGIVYVSKIHDRINYLMVTKYSLLSLLALDSPYLPEDLDDTCGCSVELVLFQDHIRNYFNPHRVKLIDIGLENLGAYSVPATLNNATAVITDSLFALRKNIAESKLRQIYADHLADTNPHGVTAEQVSLGNLNNVILADLRDLSAAVSAIF